MKPIVTALVLLASGIAGAAGGYYYARHETGSHGAVAAAAASSPGAATPPACTAERALYFRDPDNASDYSQTAKKNAVGRDYLPVCDEEEPSFDPKPKAPPATANGGARKILYYRNPMGLPDISPIPKKDSMGMDYIPVYEGEEPDDGKTVKVKLEKVQRSGVRSEVAEARVLVTPVRAVGTVKYDERRLTVVAMRSEGYVEELFVNTTGQKVKAGEPLFRVYSRDIQLAQVDLGISISVDKRGLSSEFGGQSMDGSMQRLRNLAVPESHIQKLKTGAKPRTIDWPAPETGTVIEKRVINGQRVMPGDELYRIADLSRMWVIAEVAEADIGAIKVGTNATVTVRAYPHDPIRGTVTFIYPDLRPETRTVRVRIEVPNPDERLKIDMYADVAFRAGADGEPVVAVPDSAVIDSGTRRIVLVSKGEGRFEPRAVKLGRRGEGFVEVLDGIKEGESVVTAATFLIDSESNLNAALKAFAPPPEGQP
jgi:Cu(I)/Ag(I) efflux system membrane fusion protein